MFSGCSEAMYKVDYCGQKDKYSNAQDSYKAGSEVELCVKAKAVLGEQGVKARVVSMPCFEEFEKQSEEYKASVLPKFVKARVCVEAACPYSWYKYAGNYGEIVAMSTFGASAPAGKLFAHFGFTVENVVEKALASIAKNK